MRRLLVLNQGAMNCADHESIVRWLISQKQIVSIWLDEMENATSVDEGLLEKLEEHERWLARSITELTSDR
ncbi:MAG: hypothetical protein R3C54_14150 [Parvularculaceae bacterium]